MIKKLNPEYLLQNLIDHGDVYLAPRDNNGEIIGPLVCYPETYNDGGEVKHYVGCAWFNTDKIVGYFRTRDFFTRILIEEILGKNLEPSIFIGLLNGGIIIALTLNNLFKKTVSFFEEDKESNLILDLDTLAEGSKVVLVVDVCRSIVFLDKMVDMIVRKRAEVIAIVCSFNQLPYDSWKGIPILSVLHIEEPMYQQNAPEVKELMKNYNFVSNPKEHFDFLEEEMKKRNKQSKN